MDSEPLERKLAAILYADVAGYSRLTGENEEGMHRALSAYLDTLFNLRRDPYEKVAEESGLYINWMAHKMWAFGPTKRLVQQHLATSKAFPPRRPSAASNHKEIAEKAAQEARIGAIGPSRGETSHPICSETE